MRPGSAICYLALLSTAALSAEEREPRVIFNDDAQMLMETPSEGASQFVRDWLDREVAAVPFSTFVFLAATPDLCTYETQAGEVYGDRFGPGFSKGWAPGIRALRAEQTDALRVVTEHMHRRGKEVLAAIRMSDTHHRSISLQDPLCSKFAVENPQYVIRQPDGRTNETALDYSHPEVRQHRLDIVREVVSEYDVDGLELNFVRWAKHFPRDQGRNRAPIMTELVRQIRKTLAAAAQQRGRKRLTLGIRVPESIAACWLAGIDVETWVRRGWIDYVVISTWNNTDPQLRVDEFSRFTKPAGVETIVVMGNMIGPVYSGPPTILDRPVAMSAKHRANSYQAMLLTESEARGVAANYYAWGADSISFWNVGIHFGGESTATPEQRARIARWTRAVRSQAQVELGPRTYRYLPLGKGMSERRPPVRNYPWAEEGRSPLGHVNSPVLTFGPDQTGKRLVFPFRMADGRQGEKLIGQMTFWVYYLEDNAELVVDVNGQRIPGDRIRRVRAGSRRGGIPGQRLEIDLENCPALRGANELGLTLMESAGRTPPRMEELEVVVRRVAKVGRNPNPQRKVYIAVDSEGPTGVSEYWARNRTPDDPAVRRFRELMTDDVNAAIAGCFAGGATEVCVSDDGFRDENLIADRLDRRARLLPAGSGLLSGLDQSFAGVMLVGFHAMEGAPDAVLDHTWSSARRRRYWFNGKEGGEVAAYAIVAGHDHRLPIIMVTGCAGLCREVRGLLGEQTVTVAVKRKLKDGTVELDPPSRTGRAIREGARQALKNLDSCRPLRVKFPLHVRLQLENSQVTAGYLKWRRDNKPDWPGRRAGSNTLEGVLRTTRHIVF